VWTCLVRGVASHSRKLLLSRFLVGDDSFMPKAASSSKKEASNSPQDENPVAATVDAPIATPGSADGKYTVVARRYRPRDFSELVGQQTVVQALTTAIQTNRVGHAYLFTGARGVGKTSSARIFAKALNASADGSGAFDPNSDVAQAIDSGEDMDVLEIDGASNRGIDEIRQLRASVSARPSRSPYKIYIIDEVHMLTMPAFNALLKTLEEPPPHVKFIFCTTDPEKVPITVLSRCQRFDFAPVKTDQILERLQFICKNEGATAEPEALQLIARRAAGSMRDSQSLLEQILSFADSKITTATVHEMLGTADESRLAEIADALINRDNAQVLLLLHQAVEAGVDAGQLGEQILGYLRDMMTIGVGASVELLRTANPARAEELAAAAKRWGTMTLLSAIQILDGSLVKMRHSTQSRTILEVAMVQICHLQDLQGLADLIRGLQAGKSPPTIPSASSTTAPGRVAAAAPKQLSSDTEKKKPELIAATRVDVSIPSIDVANDSVHEAINNSLGSDQEPKAKAIELRSADLQNFATAVTSLDSLAQDNSMPPSTPSSTVFSEEQPNELSVENSAATHLAKDASNSSTEQGYDAVATTPMGSWKQALSHVDGMVADYASMVVKIESVGKQASPNGTDAINWTAFFPLGADLAMRHCNDLTHRKSIEAALQTVVSQPIHLTLQMSNLPPRVNAATPKPVAPIANQPTLVRKYSEHPLVKSLIKSIDGDIVRVDIKP
jgi:DNA polymerase III subunit gamma/tau